MARAQAELDRDSGPRKSLCGTSVLTKIRVRKALWGWESACAKTACIPSFWGGGGRQIKRVRRERLLQLQLYPPQSAT